MRMKAIRSLRELTRILDVDKRIRRLCLIKNGERGYTRSVLSRFTRRIGADRLQLIIEEKVAWLLKRSGVSEVDVVLDASFVKAWSIRHPDNGRVGFSDPDAMVGRNGRGYDLGYKLHASVDHRRIRARAQVLAKDEVIVLGPGGNHTLVYSLDAAGYVEVDFRASGEVFHWVGSSIVDGVFYSRYPPFPQTSKAGVFRVPAASNLYIYLINPDQGKEVEVTLSLSYVY